MYELAKKLIFAETSIESSVYYHKVAELASRIKPSRASKKIIKHVKNIYFKNMGLLKEGFTPETNNTMEQLFSLVNSFIEQEKSFKTYKDELDSDKIEEFEERFDTIIAEGLNINPPPLK